MRMKVFALCGLMAALLAVAPAQAQYQVGDTVADFTLNDHTGTAVSLSDYAGKVVMLNFWRFG
jgi:cytochrome oxidase Cu insertion factor (SCO1/SenC/PrrC family)